MNRMFAVHSLAIARPLQARKAPPLIHVLRERRYKRYEAFDAHLDKEVLAEARSWFDTFDASQLPKGNTTFARSSGPGGQHVNKLSQYQCDALDGAPGRGLRDCMLTVHSSGPRQRLSLCIKSRTCWLFFPNLSTPPSEHQDITPPTMTLSLSMPSLIARGRPTLKRMVGS